MSFSITPLVSVVIPTYNHAHCLGRSLQSVIDQTYTNWEVIVIDNHSSDNTDAVLKRFSDERIKILKIHNNGVISASRNVGIYAAFGKWIAFLDSDDWWTPNKLFRSVSALEGGADLVYHDLYLVQSRSQTVYQKRTKSSRPHHPIFVTLLCDGMSIPNSSVVVRRDFLLSIGGISENPDLIAVEDLDTWLRLSQLTEHFVRIPDCFGYCWIGGGNISTPSSLGIARIRAIYALYTNKLPLKLQRRAKGLLAYRVGRIAQLHGDVVTAVESMKTALIHPVRIVYRVKAFCVILQLLFRATAVTLK